VYKVTPTRPRAGPPGTRREESSPRESLWHRRAALFVRQANFHRNRRKTRESYADARTGGVTIH